MDRTTSISEMQKCIFGTKVFCSDGEEGVLTHVCFDPATRRMAHIGVRLGRFFGRTLYVPFNAVVNASGEAVTLSISRDELAAADKEEPAGALFDSKSNVTRDEGNARASLLLIAVHPDSGDLAYIVARALRPGQNTLLQQDYVKKLEPGNITVSIPEATFQTLQAYRPDSELQREVEDILFDLTPLHVDFRGIQVRVLDSVLYLDGNISSSLRGDMVQDQALGVQGLLDIENRLISDDILAGDLAMALSHDPRTHNLPIGVYPRLGGVRLSGAVHNAQQKVDAGAIARAFPGVRSVFNDLVIDANADLLKVMSSSEGGESGDKIPGKYIRHTK